MNSTKRNKRRYFRIRDHLKIKYEVVPHDKLDQIRRSIKQKQNQAQNAAVPSKTGLTFEMGDFKDPGLLYIAEMMNQLNSKMDAIIEKVLETSTSEGFSDPVMVDLSASGMRFTSANSYEVGTILNISFLLNLAPARRIDVLGEVIRLSDNQEPEKWGKSPTQIAVKFLDMDMSSVDYLVQYVFLVQRNQLRNQQYELTKNNDPS